MSQGIKGVIRKRIISLLEQCSSYHVIESSSKINEIIQADEVFICNSIWHIVPVVGLYTSTTQHWSIGPVSLIIMNMLQSELKSQIAKL